jgi:hypothetical protein
MSKYSGDDQYQMMIHMIFNGCIKPRFELSEIKQWNPVFAAEVAREISALSGFTEQEIEDVRNLSQDVTDTESGE